MGGGDGGEVVVVEVAKDERSGKQPLALSAIAITVGHPREDPAIAIPLAPAIIVVDIAVGREVTRPLPLGTKDGELGIEDIAGNREVTRPPSLGTKDGEPTTGDEAKSNGMASSRAQATATKCPLTTLGYACGWYSPRDIKLQPRQS